MKAELGDRFMLFEENGNGKINLASRNDKDFEYINKNGKKVILNDEELDKEKLWSEVGVQTTGIDSVGNLIN